MSCHVVCIMYVHVLLLNIYLLCHRYSVGFHQILSHLILVLFLVIVYTTAVCVNKICQPLFKIHFVHCPCFSTLYMYR